MGSGPVSPVGSDKILESYSYGFGGFQAKQYKGFVNSFKQDFIISL